MFYVVAVCNFNEEQVLIAEPWKYTRSTQNVLVSCKWSGYARLKIYTCKMCTWGSKKLCETDAFLM